MNDINTDDGSNLGAKILPFDPSRRVTRRAEPVVERDSPDVVAVVTVSRYVAGKMRHAHRPIFASEIVQALTSDPRTATDLAELLADGAVDANTYLERLATLSAARPLTDFTFNDPASTEADA